MFLKVIQVCLEEAILCHQNNTRFRVGKLRSETLISLNNGVTLCDTSPLWGSVLSSVNWGS